MSDAAEYRLNAMICEDCANATGSPMDRGTWLRLRQTWLRLAVDEERRDASTAEERRHGSAAAEPRT
jgi:hypothetical protein